jgi:hypothetical protein|tara:strand:- start:4345 stop:4920 length:576 start_codon:yes stop_codon:yes gene_type:complete
MEYLSADEEFCLHNLLVYKDSEIVKKALSNRCSTFALELDNFYGLSLGYLEKNNFELYRVFTLEKEDKLKANTIPTDITPLLENIGESNNFIMDTLAYGSVRDSWGMWGIEIDYMNRIEPRFYVYSFEGGRTKSVEEAVFYPEEWVKPFDEYLDLRRNAEKLDKFVEKEDFIDIFRKRLSLEEKTIHPRLR